MRNSYFFVSLVSLCAVVLFLPNRGASQDPTLQQILLPYGINVETDKTGIETFAVVPGKPCQAEVIAEYSDWMFGIMSFGWYMGGHAEDTGTAIFTFNASPEDWAEFTVEGDDPFGFFIVLADAEGTPVWYWHSQAYLNVDSGCDHALVFETGEPGEYIIAWEDWPTLGDPDYNDLVVKVNLPMGVVPPPEPPPPTEIEIAIDIKPGSDPNAINTRVRRGVIPVAIFSAEDFDAVEMIDSSTLTLDGDSLDSPGEPGIAHKRPHVEDVDGDGLMDLVVHFPHDGDGIVYGDAEGIVTGKTYDDTPVIGVDTIKTVGKDRILTPARRGKGKHK